MVLTIQNGTHKNRKHCPKENEHQLMRRMKTVFAEKTT
jgi:hypothetical protein